jgi:hypothetical protein
MVIISMAARIIFAADINNNLTLRQASRVPGAYQWRGGVGWKKTEKVDSESFVGVKMATIQINQVSLTKRQRVGDILVSSD